MRTIENMNGKPVFNVPARTVINLESGFRHKLLCDGPTFSAGSACVYSCAFCYVPDIMRKNPHLKEIGNLRHDEVVIRRQGAVGAVLKQLTYADCLDRFTDPNDRRVIYGSPLVDVAGNMALVQETIDICVTILGHTPWQIRLLSKSPLLRRVAEGLSEHRERMIYGLSTGTIDNEIASAIERGTPQVSKRIECLRWLQDNGYRTFGMICPSLPQTDYLGFAMRCAEAIRPDKCEHVWGEVMNLRGESFSRSVAALAGHPVEAAMLSQVTQDKDAWEEYARATFEAHSSVFGNKLRFLQYVNKPTSSWWKDRSHLGAILL